MARSGNAITISGNVCLSSNAGVTLPNGTYDQRPANPANGTIRFNTSNNWLEYYYDSNWYTITGSIPYFIDVLVVGGGGGGGYDVGGGGGAGGLVFLSNISTYGCSCTYSITIGAGGAGSSSLSSSAAPNGANTCFGSFVALGGGGGGNYNGANPTATGAPGGSGGGGTGWTYATSGGAGTQTTDTNINLLSRICGYGNPGGNSTAGSQYTGGGGGGAGGIGTAGINSNSTFVAGGLGKYYTITGANLMYSCGGRGGGDLWTGSAAGSSNTGNGGDGAGQSTFGVPGGGGGPGGSGIVILRYIGTQRGTGGTVTSANGYTIHTFTSSGTYTA